MAKPPIDEETALEELRKLYEDQEPVTLTLSKLALWHIVTALQTTTRVGAIRTPLRNLLRTISGEVETALLPHISEAAAEMLSYGWDTQYDVHK